MKKQAFTLIEIMVWISIISIITFWVINLYSNNTSDKQKLNIFTNRLIWKIDTVKNYALVWKWIWVTLETPKYFKINFSSGSLKSYYNTWATDMIYKDLSLDPFENYYWINSIECKNLDLSNVTYSNSIDVSYIWSNITLTWCSDMYQKVIDFWVYYKWFNNILRLNTISWILEKVNK